MKRKLTGFDVAKEAGVSQSLVSLVLNNASGKKIKPETRQHVLEVAKKLGYQVNANARSMKCKKASAIGILSSWDMSSFVFPPIIKGVKSVCTKNDLAIVVCSGEKGVSDNYDFTTYYLQNRIDGLIYISYVGVKEEGIIHELLQVGMPFVCIIGARDIPNVSCVDVSFIESGVMAVNHLAEKGYKNIAYLLDDFKEQLNYAETERLQGAMSAAAEYNIHLQPVEDLVRITGENTLISTAGKLLQEGCYDAVLSTSYKCFISLNAAAKHGITVPESLGVISIDNDVYAPYLLPSLTTVDEPLFNMAEVATTILLDQIRGENICKKVELSPSLSVRESTSI